MNRPQKVGEPTWNGDDLLQFQEGGYKYGATYHAEVCGIRGHKPIRLVKLRAELSTQDGCYVEIKQVPVSTWNQLCDDTPMLYNVFQMLKQDIQKRRGFVLLCKCMQKSCVKTHWDDLSPEEKFEQTGECPFDTDGDGNCGKPLCPKCGDHTKEDKKWPPTTMETK